MNQKTKKTVRFYAKRSKTIIQTLVTKLAYIICTPKMLIIIRTCMYNYEIFFYVKVYVMIRFYTHFAKCELGWIFKFKF